jgi:hypothetical protein
MSVPRSTFLTLLGLLTACNPTVTAPAEPEESPPPAPCVTATEACTERLSLGLGRFLPLYRTHALGVRDTRIERAVIVVHGTDRNADTYFATMVASLQAAGTLASTLVVSPHFQALADAPRADEPYWSTDGWKHGDLSASDSPLARISSYAAVDTLLGVLAQRRSFPNLRSIVVTGHPAGGQFAHRYAGSSPAPDGLGSLRVRFVVANPSTYLWLRPERPADGGFARPDSAACPTWNDWPYGTSNRNSYARGTDEWGIRARLTSRDVRILLGDADTLTANLDTSCAANLQGRRRFDRGRSLVRFMDLYFPGHAHAESVVPGVGHSSREMYGSEAGRAALTVW